MSKNSKHIYSSDFQKDKILCCNPWLCMANQHFHKWCRKLCMAMSCDKPDGFLTVRSRDIWSVHGRMVLDFMCRLFREQCLCIHSGSPPQYDFIAQKFPCTVTAWSCQQTWQKPAIAPALDSCVPQELQDFTHEAYCSCIWNMYGSHLGILLVFPFQLWYMGIPLHLLLFQTENEKKVHWKKRKFTQ